jgi:diguanylate cyclase (GGDEF)-like protein
MEPTAPHSDPDAAGESDSRLPDLPSTESVAWATYHARAAQEERIHEADLSPREATREVHGHIFPEASEEWRRLERAEETDKKTGVGSDAALQRALDGEQGDRDPKTSVIFFDINNFKKVNDTAGHAVGDDALREAAEAIKQAAEPYGLSKRVFRRGDHADEFVVLAPNEVAEQIRDGAEQIFAEKKFTSGAESVIASLTGVIGNTEGEAEAGLQLRKEERKRGHGEPVGSPEKEPPDMEFTEKRMARELITWLTKRNNHNRVVDTALIEYFISLRAPKWEAEKVLGAIREAQHEADNELSDLPEMKTLEQEGLARSYEQMVKDLTAAESAIEADRQKAA